MKALFDTNVILDVLLDRAPFSEDACAVLSMVERSQISGLICATTVTTIYYLLTKALGRQKATSHTKALLSIFEVAPVNRVVLENAIASKFRDFEYAVVYEAACNAGAGYIMTRNVRDFAPSTLPVFTPSEFLKMLKSIEKT